MYVCVWCAVRTVHLVTVLSLRCTKHTLNQSAELVRGYKGHLLAEGIRQCLLMCIDCVCVCLSAGLSLAGGRWRCLSRLCWRAVLVLDLLDVLDLPGRTAELARTYGIDFFSVINRCVCVVGGGATLYMYLKNTGAVLPHWLCLRQVTYALIYRAMTQHTPQTTSHVASGMPDKLLPCCVVLCVDVSTSCPLPSGAASTVLRACWCAWPTARTTWHCHQTGNRCVCVCTPHVGVL